MRGETHRPDAPSPIAFETDARPRAPCIARAPDSAARYHPRRARRVPPTAPRDASHAFFFENADVTPDIGPPVDIRAPSPPASPLHRRTPLPSPISPDPTLQPRRWTATPNTSTASARRATRLFWSARLARLARRPDPPGRTPTPPTTTTTSSSPTRRSPAWAPRAPTTAVFESTRRGTITSATRTPPRAPAWPPRGMATARAGALDELAAEDAYAAALEEEAARRAMDDELDGAYHAAETASPGMMARVAAPEDRPRPGAFPGHLPDAGRDGPRVARRPPRKSFAMSGADPVEYAFDPRAAAEAAAAEAKREAFRAELDEQMRVKREMDDARRSGSRPRRRAPGAAPPASAAEENTYYDPGWGADLVAMGRAGVGDHVTHRDVMHGVPRRGVTSINDDYASPQRRAGGGPSSFYLGGDAFSDASLARGGDGVSFDPLRASPGANQISQAELARRQLVADLDEQVRQKREEKRLRELREELEDAKVERRIQEVIEQERREREMKERLLIEEGGAKGGDGNVGNSPRARLEDDRDEDERGEDDRGEGAGEGAAKPISAASLPDDHDALTPQRQLVRSPDVAARRPPADVHREDAHARRLGFGDGAETEPGAGAAALSVAEGNRPRLRRRFARRATHLTARALPWTAKSRGSRHNSRRAMPNSTPRRRKPRARARTGPRRTRARSRATAASHSRRDGRRGASASPRLASPRSTSIATSSTISATDTPRRSPRTGASRGRGSTVVQGDGHFVLRRGFRFRSRGRAHRRRTIARRVGPRTRTQGVHRASGRTS